MPIGVVVLLTGSTFCRFYLVSWIGERVVADICRAVFAQVIELSPAYLEVHRTGDSYRGSPPTRLCCKR